MTEALRALTEPGSTRAGVPGGVGNPPHLLQPARLAAQPTRPRDAPTPLPADFSWRLFDLNDGPVEFSKFKGKTVFLNIWADLVRTLRRRDAVDREARSSGLS